MGEYKQIVTAAISKECSEAEKVAQNLLHAPEACCIIQGLAVIACCANDMSLRSGEKGEKFNYLKTPDSFKASIYQVITSMCSVFQVAKTSMDRIYLNLKQMPELVTDILQLTKELDDPYSQHSLDYVLGKLEHSADICVDAAKKANDECSQALEVISELTQAAIATKSSSGKELQNVKLELSELRRLKTYQTETITDYKKMAAEKIKMIKEAREDYKRRISHSTVITEMVGDMFLDSVKTLVQSLGKGLENISTFPTNLAVLTTGGVKNFDSNLIKDELTARAMELVLYQLLKEIVDKSFEHIVAEVDYYIISLESTKIYLNVSKMGNMLQKTRKIFVEGLQSIKKNQVEGEKIFNEAKQHAVFTLKTFEIEKGLIEDNDEIDSFIKNVTNMTSEERQTLMQTRMEKLKNTKDALENEKLAYNKLMEEKTSAEEQLITIMNNLQRLDFEKIDLANALEYLQQGIQKLTNVQTAWNRIFVYFNYIKNTVEISMMTRIEGVTNTAKFATDINQSYVSRSRRNLVRFVLKACVTANVLMESAKFYIKISQKYIMPIIDKSISQMALREDEARLRQKEILPYFNEIKNAVQSAVDLHSQTLSTKVYDELEKQGFEVSRAIKEKKAELLKIL